MKKYIIVVVVLIVYVIGLFTIKRIYEIDELPRIAAYIPIIIGILPLLFFKTDDDKKE